MVRSLFVLIMVGVVVFVALIAMMVGYAEFRPRFMKQGPYHGRLGAMATTMKNAAVEAVKIRNRIGTDGPI